MNIGTIGSPRHWRIDDVLVHLDSEHRVSADEILHTYLTSPGILTWNPRGKLFIMEELFLKQILPLGLSIIG